MSISKILAFPCVILCLIALCGIVGAIENGQSLTVALWAFPLIGVLWLIVRKAAQK